MTDIDSIRLTYIETVSVEDEGSRMGYYDVQDREEAEREFDAAIRKIQADAWDRGQHAAFGFSVENPHFTPSDMVGTKYDNPYREEHA